MMMVFYRYLALLCTALTFGVVALGAYVRLSDAGLGCPDWPGCYGQATPAHATEAIAAAEQANPAGPVTLGKAWREMAHRYVAGGLGLLMLGLCALAWVLRQRIGYSPLLATVAVLVVGFQAMLGKWTVTLLLKPAIVTGHLVGGMTTLGLLSWLAARQWHGAARGAGAGLRFMAGVGLLLLGAQIALGGWVSTNYAALACPDLPMCQGAWLPPMDFANAFHLTRELGMTGDGALLPAAALTAIHLTHRVGAVVVSSWLVLLAMGLVLSRRRPGMGLLLLVLLVMQVGLGLANVWLSLPLPVAVAHNAGAAALVVLLVVLNFSLAPDAQALLRRRKR